jgi:hypothetical protein
VSRAKNIQTAVTKALDEHFRTLNDERTRLRSVRVLVRIGTDGKTPEQVNVSPEFEKKV